jgi:hypothetical protein
MHALWTGATARSSRAIFLVVSERDPAVEAALTRASEENGLHPDYRDCVRPLLRDPNGRWPECCGWLGLCGNVVQMIARECGRRNLRTR